MSEFDSGLFKFKDPITLWVSAKQKEGGRKMRKLYSVRCKSCGHTFYLDQAQKEAWDRGYLEPMCPNRDCKNYGEGHRNIRICESIWEVKQVKENE
jgi:hypothetical protein